MNKISKEDLLEANVQITKSDTPSGERIIEYGDAENMLDVYAEQEAIAFAEFMNKNKYEPCEGKWWNSIIGSGVYLTTAELYSLYKSQP